MSERFSRTQMLLGEEAMQKLSKARVAVFGVGGVGGYVCEGLARSGVGAFDLTDSDVVSVTNINRQIIALNSTVGQYKCDAVKARIKDINPSADVTVHKCLFMPQNSELFDFNQYDYVVDAVDTVAAKVEIIVKATRCGVPVISSMGAGNKLEPAGFKVADIYNTKGDPLARIMRRELKKRGVQSLKVVYSEELPVRVSKDIQTEEEGAPRRDIPGSVAFVPSVAGLIIAAEVVKDIIKN